MASTQAINVMASTLPPGYIDLASTVQRGPQDSVSVIGYVSDFLAPSMSRGTDYQIKFVVKDNSSLPNGIEIKCFRRNANELPVIGNIGDVVLLRHFRLQNHRGALSGLSTTRSQHIVFAKDAIVSPDFRTSFQVHGNFIPHTKSPGADQPTIHEQQWVITLHNYFKNHCSPPPFAPTGPAAIRPSHRSPGRLSIAGNERDNKSARDYTFQNNQPQSYQASRPINGEPKALPRQKLARLCDLTIDENTKGTFYDLLGEVVKLYSNDQGYLDLYLTDYTSNQILTNYERGQSDSFTGRAWAGPSGKMTLHIELYPPHGPWALLNVKPGDYIFLKNVRVKFNNRGTVIGNMWPDRNFERVHVSFLSMNSSDAIELTARRKACFEQQDSSVLPKTEANALTKQRKKAREQQQEERDQAKSSKKFRKRKRRQGQMNKSYDNYGDDIISDMDIDNDSDPTAKRAKHTGKTDISSRYIINDNIRCNHPDTSLSSFEEIINNPHRLYTSPNGVKFEMAFVNAKHRARVRVIDFYPHNLRDFSQAVPDVKDLSRIEWEWNFWLVLRGANVNEQDDSCINCNVKGVDAELLIGRDIQPQDFSRANAKYALQQLEERLFQLWGDLKEHKDKFLHGHPHIKPDEEFSSIKYNISSDNLPFEACIAEYGVELLQSDGSGSVSQDEQWHRIYKMCDTEIDG